MKAIAETKNIKAFREILAETAMIVRKWKVIKDKEKICENIFSMPTEALEIKKRDKIFSELINKCREFLG